MRGALAGAVAATVWGLQEPLDRRVFACDYSDVELLGFGLHAANGAVFGIAYDAVRRRVDVDPRRLALCLALAEHLATWPLMHFVDRKLARNPRAFAQSAYRHALFGLVLGRLTSRR